MGPFDFLEYFFKVFFFLDQFEGGFRADTRDTFRVVVGAGKDAEDD